MKQLFTFLILFITPSVWAWGPMGHRIVAEVAYHYLSPEACADVDEVLGVHGMVYWSTWPDEIKSNAQIYSMSYDWHFQDIPSGLSDDQLSSMRVHYPTHGGQQWATYDQLMTQLPGHPDICTINGVDMPYHDALVFLIHLTADAMCPMHLAHEEDKGGNDVKVQWKNSDTNLHKVWDEKLIESRGFSYTEYAQMLVDTYGSTVDSLTNVKDMDCLKNVYQTTQRIYAYQSTDYTAYQYIWDWKTTCDRLLFEAGVRLANNIANIR